MFLFNCVCEYYNCLMDSWKIQNLCCNIISGEILKHTAFGAFIYIPFALFNGVS